MPFRIALSGLNAASANLSVTANNIANANTYGFKSSRSEFAEVYTSGNESLATNLSGSGVRLSAVKENFSQGNIEFTNNSLDLAIGGEGFFTMEQAGARAYSRAGNFSVDREGYVVNPQGGRLQGFPHVGEGNFNGGVLQDMRVLAGTSAPLATETINVGINLPADIELPANPVFDATDPSSYNHTTSTTVFDSLGVPHTATFYYIKSGAPNQWEAHAHVDGNSVGPPNVLEFDPDGLLISPAGGRLTLPPYPTTTGSADLEMNLELGDSTQFGAQFAVNSLIQDGYTTGRLVGINVDGPGVMFARFTNGQSSPLGKVALANFPNPNGLKNKSDTAWTESFSSGGVVLGEAGSASFGLISAGALETSNVDLTAELVNMITAQRSFQANAQVITAADQVTQTALNMIR